MRLSHADRETLVTRLQDALEEGYLDLGEFDERVAKAHQARFVADTKGLLDDIPDGQIDIVSGRSVTEFTEPLTLDANMGSQKQKGVWTVPEDVEVKASMGTVVLDFRQAEMPHERVNVHVSSFAGKVVLILPDDWIAQDNVTASMGSVSNKCGQSDQRPKRRVRVTGKAHMGSVKIRREHRFLWWRW